MANTIKLRTAECRHDSDYKEYCGLVYVPGKIIEMNLADFNGITIDIRHSNNIRDSFERGPAKSGWIVYLSSFSTIHEFDLYFDSENILKEFLKKVIDRGCPIIFDYTVSLSLYSKIASVFPMNIDSEIRRAMTTEHFRNRTGIIELESPENEEPFTGYTDFNWVFLVEVSCGMAGGWPMTNKITYRIKSLSMKRVSSFHGKKFILHYYYTEDVTGNQRYPGYIIFDNTDPHSALFFVDSLDSLVNICKSLFRAGVGLDYTNTVPESTVQQLKSLVRI